MTLNIRLHQLSVVGGPREGRVLFGANLTVIYGASDTGKSYVLSAVDYALGASRIKEIPEAEGSTHVLLSVELPEGDLVTLVRPFGGGRISLFEGELTTLSNQPAEYIFSARGGQTVSSFLLEILGVGDRKILRNERGGVQKLSFRNLAHLALITETSMQSETPPALTGQFVSATAERSVLRVMLQNDDDSDLEQTVPTTEDRQLSRSRVEAIRRLRLDLAELEGIAETAEEVSGRITRLDTAIAEATRLTGGLTAQRDELLSQRRDQQESSSHLAKELSERSQLASRFALLHDQYTTDLNRLGLVREAGNLLGFYEITTCPFCGADPVHQNLAQHVDLEATVFSQAVSLEEARILRLDSDLEGVREQLSIDLAILSSDLDQARASVNQLDLDIANVEVQLSPASEPLPQLLQARATADHVRNYHQQQAALSKLEVETPEFEAVERGIVRDLNPMVVRDFDSGLQRTLEAWDVPRATDTFIDPRSLELHSLDQARRDRGKGVRSILHAAFTLTIAEYCLSNSLPHPGFVILDSPVVTFRPIEGSAAPSSPEEYVSRTVFDRFYRYLNEAILAQVVVIENVNPPDIEATEGVEVHYFSGTTETGRVGFFV